MVKKIDVDIGGLVVVAEQKLFKSGRSGFGYYGVISIEGKSHRVCLNITEM